MKQIEIIGGGLAGLSLGIALRRKGLPVLLREASSYPRHRVCGEFINGVTFGTLKALEIEEVFEGALQHRKTRWWIGGRKILEAELEHPALGMSRWEMDEKLRTLFEKAGGQLSTNDRAAFEAREGRVWTAGRKLDRQSSLLGLKAHFEGVELDGALEMHIGEGSYLGLTPVTSDGSRVNVCGLFQASERNAKVNPIVDALERSGLRVLAARLREGHMIRQSLTGISGIKLGRQLVENVDLCTLGDAERMIPPFTGNGMSMAFESAECAMRPLVDYSAGDLRWEEARQQIAEALERRFHERVRLALFLHRCLTHWAGRVALSAAATSGLLPFRELHRRLS